MSASDGTLVMLPFTAVAVTLYSTPGLRLPTWQVVLVGAAWGGLLQSTEKQALAGVMGHSFSTNFCHPPVGASNGGVTVTSVVVWDVLASSFVTAGLLQTGFPCGVQACEKRHWKGPHAALVQRVRAAGQQQHRQRAHNAKSDSSWQIACWQTLTARRRW